MKRIIVIGSPGSGKSVFSRELNRITNIPLFHMDCVFWKENWTHLSKEEMRDEASKIIKNDSYIIDGNYFDTMEMRIEASDTIFFLDIDRDTCIKSVKERTGKKRPDLPDFLEEYEDPEFIDFIIDFHNNRKNIIYDYFEKYKDKNFIILKSREDANEYIKKLENDSLKLRLAKEDEVETLTRISKDAFNTDYLVGGEPNDGPPNYSDLDWHKKIFYLGNLYSLVLNDEVIGGSVIFKKEDSVHIGRIFIDPKYMGSGKGIKLMELINEMFIGLPKDLSTPVWNIRTNELYKKCGYIEISRDDDEIAYKKAA